MASSGLDETAEEKRCATPPACLATSAGARIPIIAASSRSTSSPMPPLSRRSSRPRLSGARRVLPPCRPGCDDELSPHVRELATARMIDRARFSARRCGVAYLVSAAMPGVLPRTPLVVERGS